MQNKLFTDCEPSSSAQQRLIRKLVVTLLSLVTQLMWPNSANDHWFSYQLFICGLC